MNNDNDGHNLLCLICANVHVYPRIYKCGHTVCSCCMQEIDVREHSSTFEVPIYKCPCCREKTIIPWNKRPLNRVLETLCKSHPDYKSRKKEVDILLKDRTQMVEIPENVDISRISYKCMKSLAGDLYSKILPVLYEAAICGKSFVTITEENFVSQIEACVTELKKLLFDNNIFNNQKEESKEEVDYLGLGETIPGGGGGGSTTILRLTNSLSPVVNLDILKSVLSSSSSSSLSWGL